MECPSLKGRTAIRINALTPIAKSSTSIIIIFMMLSDGKHIVHDSYMCATVLERSSEQLKAKKLPIHVAGELREPASL
jgi:hypothetical protein